MSDKKIIEAEPVMKTTDISRIRTLGGAEMAGLITSRLQSARTHLQQGKALPAAESEQIEILLGLLDPMIQAGHLPKLIQLNKISSKVVADKQASMQKDLDVPAWQRQGKTRSDMGINDPDGGKIPGPNEIASGQIESIEEELSREAVQKMVGDDTALTQKVMMAYGMMKKGEGIPPSHAQPFFQFIKPVLDSLTGSDAVDSISRHKEKFAQDVEPEVEPQEPQQPDQPDQGPEDVGQQKTHKDLGQVRVINSTMPKADDEAIVQTDDGKVVKVKLADIEEGMEIEAINLDELKMLAGLSEAMSDAYGDADSPEHVEGSVEFKQHKNTDKGSVSIEASGDDMQELAKVLKMAGLTLPQDMYKDEPEADDEPEAHDEPEVQVVEPDSDEESPCGTSDADASYSTDKEVLVNYIKDKLAKRLS
jgi:hypothetical protein